ncbi:MULTISPECIES: glutathione S-transferase family protein [unclassified Sphingomonas]|uniref:glutathione S-transferase family protein n=1 Tax=unclassified Sphingomonas TaxID=196159 RepID=UPI0022699AC5|nr:MULTISPECIES: glutathione S-transferase family protein [unclassified Sphingomonas]
MSIRLWGRRHSHNVRKVSWFLEELGVAYERIDIGGEFGMSEHYRSLNPNALIPTIEDDGLILWESNAILRYLASHYGGDCFWPGDPRARARSDRWMDWQMGFARAQLDAFVNLARKTPEERDDDAIDRSAAASSDMMRILDGYLAEDPWLPGKAFGVGDIPMGVYAHTFFEPALGTEADFPNVRQWYQQLKSRGAYTDEVMLPLQ